MRPIGSIHAFSEKIEIVGFPIYILLLLVLASVWIMCKIMDAGRSIHFLCDCGDYISLLVQFR